MALVACLALAGCAASRPMTPGPPVSVPVRTPPGGSATPIPAGTDVSATPTAATGPKRLADIVLSLEPVATGFDAPLQVTGAGDGSGRLFVVEQGGHVHVIRGNAVSAKTFLDLSAKVSTGGERGLLGIAFSPDYASSGRFYVDYTDSSGNTVIARYTAKDPSSDSPALSKATVLLRVRQPYANHNGGGMAFQPGTKRLWVGMGDGGSAGDPGNRAQNNTVLLGKMLVFDLTKSATPKPSIAIKGVRNPWRFSFDRATRDLWIGDVGQNAWEEIDYLPAGKTTGRNLGWNRWEGSHAYPPGAKRSRTGYTFPIAQYAHPGGESVTGGYVYRGEQQPALVGTYLYGDFVKGWVAGIRRVDPDGTLRASPEKRTLLRRVGMPSSFGEDDTGELYLVDYRGSVLRVVAR
jgi:glucose/arabinose dehydrogenase